MDHVWVVTRWEWGGGGDDDRVVIGVFSTAEKAYTAAASDPGEHEIITFLLDEPVLVRR